MKPNLKTIKEHLNGIPSRRLPIGKIAWLQEWEETKELVESLEKQLREIYKFATKYKLPSDYPRDAKLIEKLLGEEK